MVQKNAIACVDSYKSKSIIAERKLFMHLSQKFCIFHFVENFVLLFSYQQKETSNCVFKEG